VEKLILKPMQTPTRPNHDGKMEHSNGVYVWVESTLANLREVFASEEVFEHVYGYIKDLDRWRFDKMPLIGGQ